LEGGIGLGKIGSDKVLHHRAEINKVLDVGINRVKDRSGIDLRNKEEGEDNKEGLGIH